MKLIVLAPLVALALAGGSAGAYFWVTSEGSVEEAAVAQPTPTPTPTPAPQPTATPTLAPSPTPTGASLPEGWATYVDPVLAFSLRYPPDMVFKDLSAGAAGQRALQFRSQSEPSRSFSISISPNQVGLTPEQWLSDNAACLSKTIKQGIIDGQAAAFCTSQPEEIPEAAVAFAHMGNLIFITSIMPAFGFQSEFELVMASIQL